MLPLSTLIILGVVVAFVTGTFLFAIYWTAKTRLEARRLKESEAEAELRTPLRETAAEPGLLPRNPPPLPPAPLPPRPPTPEAEFPPPLPDDVALPNQQIENVQAARAESPPLFLLPALTYCPTPSHASNQPRAPTPEADYPPPLPTDFPGRMFSPLPPRSPLLPPPPSLLASSSSKDPPKQRSQSRSRRDPPGEQHRAAKPALPPKQDRPDSMHEIYDIYSQLPPTPKVMPKSAPAGVTTFAQAESKWGYFGQKREESRSRDRARERERQVEVTMF